MRKTSPRHLLALFAVASFAPVVAGCADVTADDQAVVGSVASAVQGGALDTEAKNNFAVGIANRFGGVCSGTLIAPNLVLTARHCVVVPEGDSAVTCADKFKSSVSPSALFITTSPNLFRAEKYYAASEIITPPENGFCGNDIALVILEEMVPESEARAATPVVQFPMTDPRIGASITALGYGITSPSAQDSGRRRIRQNIQLICIPGSGDRECERFSDSDAEFVTEGWVCSGDSGGGAFDQGSFDSGEPFVLGALSRGPQTESRCLAAIYTRTDSHAPMIIDAGVRAAELGGYDAPAWTRSIDEEPEEIEISPTPEPTCDGETCTSVDATEPPAVVRRTTTTGCSSSPATPGTASFGAVGLALVGLALAGRRRR